MKAGIVLFLCLVSSHVLLVCSTAETTASTDDGSITTPKSINADHSVSDVQQDPNLLVEEASNSLDNKNVKIAGVFLNFTRELVNYTNTAFGKNKHTSDETEQEEDVRIQDLLRGILADEFGSEEDDINDDSDSEEIDVFHDESEEFEDDNESPSSSTVGSVEASSRPNPTDSTDIPNNLEADSDNADAQDEQHSDNEDDDKLDSNTEEVDTEEVVSERTSRADTVETTESGEREGRSRERKTSRPGNKQKKNKHGQKKKGKTDAAKYNRYVDAVFKRMNTLIRNKRMDPLRVNLYAGNTHANNKVAAKLRKTGSRGPSRNNGKRGKPGKRRTSTGRFNPKITRRRTVPRTETKGKTQHQRPHHRARREESSKLDNKMRPSSIESIANKTVAAAATSEESLNASSESKEMKPNQEGRPTRGVLHGLSTLRRTGPVKVVRRGQNTRIVRTKFLLGPVALEILSKKSNFTKTNSPSATATARSLKGVLEIRLKNSGPTRIRRLRVFPPSNVRVEGESNGMKKQGYRKITPVAARRLMSVANQVVRQSDRHRTKPSKKKGVKKQAGRKGQPKNNRKSGK
ncbi:unnamed protein product [Allacma fusca]|uniref:Uncharacterized protein n=1 Tax=Allacma fusca TaxID=39272 RepID=A0A8J2K5T2_9HEXA|nr:unnamed protein product [Allacma fusca]